jgi:hypothetical protein
MATITNPRACGAPRPDEPDAQAVNRHIDQPVGDEGGHHDRIRILG